MVTVVHDNISNMVFDSDLLEDWSDLPCFRHMLQIAVSAGLDIDSINKLIGVCKNSCMLQAQCCGINSFT